MAYLVPRVLIKQEFEQLPVFSNQPLSALILGPQYNLYRYSNLAEKVYTSVLHPDDPLLGNTYQYEDTVTYDFPNQVAGTIVDESFTKVFFDQAQVKYFPIGGASVEAVLRVAVPGVGGQYYSNRFSCANLVFKTGNGYNRSATFSNRDVKPGDYLKLVDQDNVVATVKVKAIHPSFTTAAQNPAETADSGNAVVAAADINDAVVPDAGNAALTGGGVDPANETSAYVGYKELGIYTDTYTVEVTSGSDLATARFKITSAEGAFATKTDQALIGTPDAHTLVVDNAGGNSVTLDFTLTLDENINIGDKWTLTVRALVNANIPTAIVPFTGPSDIVYKLTVVRGGPFYNGSNEDVCARVSVTSDNIDSSATVNVESDTYFDIGSFGATAKFANASMDGGLILGDVFYVPFEASVADKLNIIETFEVLPTTLRNASKTWDVTEMRLVKNFEVPQRIDGDEDNLNWEVDGNTIIVNPGIQTTESTIVSGTDPIKLDVTTAGVHVEHRDLVQTNTVAIGSVTSTSEVAAKLGKVDVDNPLAMAVYDAVLNSAGVPVYYIGVATNNLAGYTAALGLAEQGRYYGLVPLTFDRTIQDAVVGHVNAMSTAESARWRVTWLSSLLNTSSLLYDLDDDGEPWKATMVDDPQATGTQNTLVTIAGATFVTDGIRVGDNLLINFRYDAAGKQIHDTFVVAEVRTETTLVTVSGPAAPINVAVKAQIERVYTSDEQIDMLSLVGGEFNNRRVRMVFPSTTKDGSVVKPGYHVAAALAGLRSGVVPHQGLTNSPILGFTDVSQALLDFTATQLDRLAEQGFVIVTQAVVGASPYVRHQLTTATESLNTSEDSITANVDSIAYGLQDALAPYIGIYNINKTAVSIIKGAITSQLNFRETKTFTARAGNQLLSYKITKLEQDATFKDRIVAVVTLEVPYPLNFVDLTLVV